MALEMVILFLLFVIVFFTSVTIKSIAFLIVDLKETVYLDYFVVSV